MAVLKAFCGAAILLPRVERSRSTACRSRWLFNRSARYATLFGGTASVPPYELSPIQRQIEQQILRL